MNAIPFIIENLLAFAVLFAGIWLIKKLFNKQMSAQLHFLIWGAVVLKLLIPIGLPSAASPWSWLSAQAAPASVQNNYEAYAPSVAESSPVYENSASDNTNNIVSDNDQTLKPINGGAAAGSVSRMPVMIDWNVIIISVWLSGIAARLAWLGLKSRRFRKKLLINEINPPFWVRKCFDSCLREVGIKKDARLVLQDAFPVPAVTGLIKPVLILPQEMLQNRNPERLRHVMIHEMAHIVRKDTFIVSLLNILSAVYWFNPLVWLCFKLIRADMETACDCRVIKALGKDKRQSYIETVLQFAGRNDSLWLRAAVGINDGQRNMERRILGMFMRARTKRCVIVPVVILALILAFTCFTTACQPINEKPAVNLHWSPKPPESYKVSEHWSENVEKNNVRIVIDADVFMPDTDEYPVVRLERAAFTQQRVDELVNYFAKGKKLYLPRPMTKADYQQQIDNAKRGELVNGVYVDTGWSLDDIKQLEQSQAAAPEGPPPIIYTDTTLKYAKDETGKELTEYGKNFLSVKIGNGDASDASIGIWNSADDSSAYFSYWKHLSNDITESMYQENIIDGGSTEVECGYSGAGELFGKVDITRDEAIAQADKVISGLGINGLMLVNAERYVTPNAPEQGGYKLEYFRQSGGIPLCWIEVPLTNGAEKLPPYSKPFIEEVLVAYITKDGLTCLRWIGYANVVETVSENSELMPFESIKQALKDRIFYKNSFYQVPSDFTVTVTSAELRMGYIGVKDNAKQALMVPVWFFRTEETYTENGKTILFNKITYMLNALDGGAIESRLGVIM